MNTMLMVVIISSSGLLTGWTHIYPTESECQTVRRQVAISAYRNDSRDVVTTAQCVEPLKMRKQK